MIKFFKAFNTLQGFKLKVIVIILLGSLILVTYSINYIDDLVTADNEQTERQLQIYEVAPDDVEGLSFPSWSRNYFVNENGELIVQIPPCLTPMPPDDYRELLPPGTIQCNDNICIQGFEVEGQPQPTRFFGQPEFIDPEAVTIVYQSSGSCP